MQGDILRSARKIAKNVNDIINYKKLKNQKPRINQLLDEILIENKNIFKNITPKKIINKAPITKSYLPAPKPINIEETPKPEEFSSEKFMNLTKKEKHDYIKDLGIDRYYIKKFISEYTKSSAKEIKKTDYTIYKPSSLGEFANKLMKKPADNLIGKYGDFFKPMFKNFLTVEMDLLSRSYVSMMLLFTIISLPLSFLFFLAMENTFRLNIIGVILLSLITSVATFFGFYFYPASLINEKSKKIKLELPFALVHMSAVAGSGAQPLSIFELIAESEEYPELRKEIKKILNYVNLFGFNLSNALRNVANTNASPEFKELLNGMVSTIETGGDLKDYLKEKADDALNIYKLDRKKQVEALATYSEVYTSILIAAPLLLLVTLAIINSIGGNIGGLDAKVAAWIGVGGILPLLNIAFMFFINASQKGL